MPLYEYRCTSCGHQQEFLQKWSDAPLTACTACGKETFSKLLTAAGFQLKGSGWYATDFKNSGSKSAPAASAAKGDAKPAGDAAPKGDAPSAEAKKESAPPASGSGGCAASS